MTEKEKEKEKEKEMIKKMSQLGCVSWKPLTFGPGRPNL